MTYRRARHSLGFSFLVLSLLIALAGILPAQRTRNPVILKGRVVDAQGQPAGGVTVSAFWAMREGKPTPLQGTTSGADGHFECPVPFAGKRALALTAIDSESRRGATVYVPPDGLGEEYLLTLGPLVRAHGVIAPPEAGATPSRGSLTLWRTEPGKSGIRVYSARNTGGTFEFWLPVGEYRITSYMGRLHRFPNVSFTIDGSKEAVDLGTRAIEKTRLGAMRGQKAMEWNVTAVRQLPSDLAEKGSAITLEDFRGRWLIIEFWGYW